MRLRKKKGDTSTVRKVYNDDLTRCYGVVGTIHDLIQYGIMVYSDYDHALWCYIPDAALPPHFGKSRDEALEMLNTEDTIC